MLKVGFNSIKCVQKNAFMNLKTKNKLNFRNFCSNSKNSTGKDIKETVILKSSKSKSKSTNEIKENHVDSKTSSDDLNKFVQSLKSGKSIKPSNANPKKPSVSKSKNTSKATASDFGFNSKKNGVCLYS